MKSATFTLTKLRSDVLSIFHQSQAPIKAYQLLEKLRVIRPNSQPPTVYRVLDFLKNKNIIHEITYQNSYILCQHNPDHCSSCSSTTSHCTTVLLICLKCHKVKEQLSKQLFGPLDSYTKTYHFKLAQSSTIELIGLCARCQ